MRSASSTAPSSPCSRRCSRPRSAPPPRILAFASGLWFAAFAALQIPVGHALDTIGPRRTAGGLFVAAAAGAAVFAMAEGPLAVNLAMVLIGIGCSPVLMASFYIFARSFSPAVFASLGGLLIGISTMGNIASAAPMAWAAEAFGWRACLWGLAAFSLAVAVAVLALVRDPARLAAPEGDRGRRLGPSSAVRRCSCSCRSPSSTTRRSAACAAFGPGPTSPRSSASMPWRSATSPSRWAWR